MKTITENDLIQLQKALEKDYGIKLKGKDLYTTACSLLRFFEALIDYDQKDKEVRKSS